MQDAKLIKRLFLKCSFRGVLAKQDYCIRSNNFTDFLDFCSRLRKVMKPYPRQIRNAAFNPPMKRQRRWNSPSCAALVFIGDIAHGEQMSWCQLFLSAPKRV